MLKLKLKLTQRERKKVRFGFPDQVLEVVGNGMRGFSPGGGGRTGKFDLCLRKVFD